MKQVVTTLYANFTGAFSREEANRSLNIFHVGHPNANALDKDGNIIPIEHPNMDALQNAQYKLGPSRCLEISCDLYSDGSFGNFQVCKESLQ
jgi:hypothetical protein